MRDKAKQNAAELAKRVAQVDIEVPPNARVSVDGKPLDETPKEPVPVQPGRHTIEATFDGRVKSITIDCVAGNVVKAKIEFDTAGATEPPREQRSSSWSTGRIVTVSALAVGAVAGGVLFFVFQGSAQGNVDDSKALLNGGSCLGVTNAECTKAASLKDDRDSNVTLSTVSLVAGGVFAAGAVAAAVLCRRVRKNPPVSSPMSRPALPVRASSEASEENANASMDRWNGRGRGHHGVGARVQRGHRLRLRAVPGRGGGE